LCKKPWYLQIIIHNEKKWKKRKHFLPWEHINIIEVQYAINEFNQLGTNYRSRNDEIEMKNREKWQTEEKSTVIKQRLKFHIFNNEYKTLSRPIKGHSIN